MEIRLLVEIDETLKQRVKSKAYAEGKTLKEIIASLLIKYLEE